MTGAILAAVEIEREAAALAQAETYAQAKTRRRAERVAEKLFARARIAALIAPASTTSLAST